jgi:hypothetical protein
MNFNIAKAHVEVITAKAVVLVLATVKLLVSDTKVKTPVAVVVSL